MVDPSNLLQEECTNTHLGYFFFDLSLSKLAFLISAGYWAFCPYPVSLFMRHLYVKLLSYLKEKFK